MFEVLKNPTELADTEIFHAASILKNKMMYDFPSFKMQTGGDMAVLGKMQTEIIQII